MSTKCRIRNFQPGFFAIPVGLAGLAIAYEKLASILNNNTLCLIGKYLGIGAIAVWFIIALLYILKFVLNKEGVIKDFQHPIKSTILSLAPIGLLVSSIALSKFFPQFAFTLSIAGAIVQILFTFYIFRFWLNKDIHLDHITPTWYIPVVGNILVPITPLNKILGIFNYFFLSFGLIFWIILTTIIYYRKFFHSPISDELLPSLFIMLAPPSIGFISYYNVTHTFDTFAHILYFIALSFFFVLLTIFDKFFKIEFRITWWAYIFPIDALTIATFLYYHLDKNVLFLKLGEAFLALATILLVIITYKTLKAIKKGEICLRAEQ